MKSLIAFCFWVLAMWVIWLVAMPAWDQATRWLASAR